MWATWGPGIFGREPGSGSGGGREAAFRPSDRVGYDLTRLRAPARSWRDTLLPSSGVPGVHQQGAWVPTYAQEKRGGLRLSAQSVRIWSWSQVARVTLRMVRSPVRTTLAAKSMTVRRSRVG